MFEQAFKNIDDVLWKDAGCTSELDYTEQTSWLLFLKYLDALEHDKATEAALDGRKYTHILDKAYRWEAWAAPKNASGQITTLASKAAQPDITHSLFKVQPIQIPPRDYQDKAIAVIDEMREETQRLARLYERKHAALEALKKSLLHQAFAGEL